jgi:glycosyltransferase involved in cell wall biosynthesis
MKIIQLNTYDIDGGAARAAYRLHRGLIEIGQKSRLLTTSKRSRDETVSLLSPQPRTGESDSDYLSLIQKHYISANRTPLSNTLFSLPYPGLDLTQLQDILAADIINLHWIAHFQSPVTLKKLLDLGKPVVWTLHDMWAFTGGCHYASGCNQYQEDCTNCPQLAQDHYHLASAILKDKLDRLTHANLTIVTPSQWLAELARNSRLFRHHRVEVIPYSLETDIFVPLVKATAKQRLGIAPDTMTLLAGAGDGNERRKGFSELLQALEICGEDDRWRDIVKTGRVTLLCFGVPNERLHSLDLPVVFLGRITSDEKLSEIYSAADLFILPSLEDNLPNTLLESMSCGTPVIAFPVGGIPDIVENGVTGRILSTINPKEMAQAIIECAGDQALCWQMGEKSRQVMESHHALPVQAKHYLDLYRDLLENQSVADGRAIFDVSGDVLVAPVPVELTRGENFDRIFPQLVLESLRDELARLREQLARTEGELEISRTVTGQTQAELSEARIELERTQEELGRVRGRVLAMESSKFWRLRSLWFQFKRALGLTTEID